MEKTILIGQIGQFSLENAYKVGDNTKKKFQAAKAVAFGYLNPQKRFMMLSKIAIMFVQLCLLPTFPILLRFRSFSEHLGSQYLASPPSEHLQNEKHVWHAAVVKNKMLHTFADPGSNHLRGCLIFWLRASVKKSLVQDSCPICSSRFTLK